MQAEGKLLINQRKQIRNRWERGTILKYQMSDGRVGT